MTSDVQSLWSLQEVADKIDLLATTALKDVVGKVEPVSLDAATHLRLALDRFETPGQSVGGALIARRAVRDALVALGDAAGLEKEVAAAERAVRDAAIPRTRMRCPPRDREAFVKVLETEFEAIVDDIPQEEAAQELPRLLHAYRKVATEWFSEDAFVSKGEQEAALSGRPRRQPKPSKSARGGAGQPRAASTSTAGLDRLVKEVTPEDPYEDKDIRRLLIETSDPIPDGDGKWQNEETAAAVLGAVRAVPTLDGRWTDGEGHVYTISGHELWCGERSVAEWDWAINEVAFQEGGGWTCTARGVDGKWIGAVSTDGTLQWWTSTVVNSFVMCISVSTWVRIHERGPTR